MEMKLNTELTCLESTFKGICVMLSLTAGGNGANNFRNDTPVSKEQTNFFIFFCFLLWGLCFSFLHGVNGSFPRNEEMNAQANEEDGHKRTAKI